MKQAAIGFALVVAIVAFAFFAGRSDGTGETEAVTQCEGFADKRLKAPATAEYDLTASRAGEGWVIVGTVDSENGFGAKIRNAVRCEIHFAGDAAYLDDIAIS